MSTPKKMKTETSVAILNSEPPVPGKREDYINWDDFFMGVAVLAAQRSKDPETQVGACVVNPEKQIVGVGYNTMPYLGDNKNNDDHEHFPWKSLGKIFTKHEYVCYAITNAIVNKNPMNASNGTIYVTLFPSNQCAKLLIKTGITKVFYLTNKYGNFQEMKAAKIMLEAANIDVQQYTSTNRILLDFSQM